MHLNARATALTIIAVTLLVFAPPLARSSSALPIIYIDEFGTGILDFGGAPVPTTGVLKSDPGPGGLSSVLTYDLLGPPSLVAGDVLMFDVAEGSIRDVIRFNPAGTGSASYPASVLFYSDNLDGFDAPADTPAPPGALYPNVLTINEVALGPLPFVVIPAPEGVKGALYTPLAGQPGFVSGFATSYVFISDGQLQLQRPVPEPATLTLLGVGSALSIGKRRLRRKRNASVA
jgi:PEP-CTERM motif